MHTGDDKCRRKKRAFAVRRRPGPESIVGRRGRSRKHFAVVIGCDLRSAVGRNDVLRPSATSQVARILDFLRSVHPSLPRDDLGFLQQRRTFLADRSLSRKATRDAMGFERIRLVPP